MNKTIKFFIFLFLIVSNVQGQTLKVKKEKFANKISYEYSIEKKSKIRTGNFQFLLSDNVVVNGQFTNDKKSGEWQFYDNDKLILTVHYDNDTIIEIKETESTTSYEETYKEKVMQLVKKQAVKNMKYPETAAQQGKKGIAQVQLKFNAFGVLMKKELSVSTGFELLDNAALKIFNNFHGLPGIENNKLVEYIITYPVVFGIQ